MNTRTISHEQYANSVENYVLQKQEVVFVAPVLRKGVITQNQNVDGQEIIGCINMDDIERKVEAFIKNGKEEATFSLHGRSFSFRRAEKEDWERIKQMSDKDLIDAYKGLCEATEQCWSVYDMQMLSLFEAELNRRDIILKG